MFRGYVITQQIALQDSLLRVYNANKRGGRKGGIMFGDLFDWLFGSSKANRQFENNIAMQKDLYGRYNKFMDNLGGLGKGGPGGFINQIASQYKESPYQQFVSNQMNTALGNNLRASGLDRSSYGLSKVASLNSDLASKGLNDFISSSLGGMQSLHGLGAQIGQNLGNSYTTYGKSINDRWLAINQMLGGLGQGIGRNLV